MGFLSLGLLSLGGFVFGAFVFGAFVSWGFCLLRLLSLGLLSLEAFVFGAFVSWGFYLWGFCLLGILSLGFLSMGFLCVRLLYMWLPSAPRSLCCFILYMFFILYNTIPSYCIMNTSLKYFFSHAFFFTPTVGINSS